MSLNRPILSILANQWSFSALTQYFELIDLLQLRVWPTGGTRKYSWNLPIECQNRINANIICLLGKAHFAYLHIFVFVVVLSDHHPVVVGQLTVPNLAPLDWLFYAFHLNIRSITKCFLLLQLICVKCSSFYLNAGGQWLTQVADFSWPAKWTSHSDK